MTTASGGGAEGIRTPDLINAIDALSQLSYSPTVKGWAWPILVIFTQTKSKPKEELSVLARGMQGKRLTWKELVNK